MHDPGSSPDKPTEAGDGVAGPSPADISHDRTDIVRPESDHEVTIGVDATVVPDALPERIGPFRILRELGRGGMGIVFLAEDEGLKRPVALKVLPETLIANPALITRFKREAEVASRLEHPNLCGVLRVGETEGQHWIAMRYVRGETLESVLRRGLAAEVLTPNDESRAVTGVEPRLAPTTLMLEKTARALQAAHEAGVVHRDLKPGNLIIDERGEPVVLDFGLALDLRSEEGAALTQSGDVLGTPYYMAPEQIRGEANRADPRVDVWALGVILYEVYGGRRPFDSPSREALYRAILEEDPTPLRKLVPSLPRDLETIVTTALSKNVERRYATARDLADDLRAVMEIRPIKARPVSRTEKFAKLVRRRPALFTLVAGTLVAVPVVATLLISRALDQRRIGDAFARSVASVASATEEARPRAARAALASAREIADPSRRGELDQLEAQIKRLEEFERARTLAFDVDADPDGRLADGLLAKIAEERPGDAGPRIWRALVRLRRGDEKGARERLETEVGRIPEAPALLASLDLDVDELAALRPRSDLQGLFEIELLAERGRPQEALRRLELALEAAPRAHGLAWLAAEQATRSQQYRAALAHAGRARVLLEGFSPLQLGRYSLHLRRAGHSEKALTLAREAYERAPQDPIVLLHYASALSDTGRTEMALTAYRTLVGRTPEMAVAWRNLASVLIEEGQFEEALAATTKAIEGDPKDASSWSNHAVALQAAGQLDEAEKAYRRALELQPNFPFVLSNLGALLKDQGQLDEAEVVAKKAVALKPDYPSGWYNLGTLHKKKKDLEAAMKAYLEAQRLDPQFAAAFVATGTLHSAAGRMVEARRDYERALAIDPTARLALINLPIALEAAGEIDEAIEIGQRARDLYPRETQGANNLASVLINAKRLEEGREVLWEAFAFDPAEEKVSLMMSVLLAETDTAASSAFIQRLEDMESEYFSHVAGFLNTLITAGASIDQEPRLQRFCKWRLLAVEERPAGEAEAMLSDLEKSSPSDDERTALIDCAVARALARCLADDDPLKSRARKEAGRREAALRAEAEARAEAADQVAAVKRRRLAPRRRLINLASPQED
jgi:serine/threonine protein kinase/Flp pilus assembly protein TadD